MPTRTDGLVTVKVVTDSTADIPPDLARQLDITVVPLNVQFGQETYRDGIDITHEEFYARLASVKVPPTTSQPSAAVFEQAYSDLGKRGYDIISIHISSLLSGTCSSAATAAAALPHLKIAVIDSRFLSMTMGWLVIAAAEAASAGQTFEEIVQLVSMMLPRLRLLAVLDTLECLKRGGRIGKTAAFLGSALDIKPLISITDGEVHPVERVRTRSKSLHRLVQLTGTLGPLERLAVAHAACPEAAERLAEQLASIYPRHKMIITEIGPVLGTHAGPGAIGICCVLAEVAPAEET